jgi:DNA repair ATPase RecN
MRGRKRVEESRATELRERLFAWKRMPESSRPSLRALARELNTTHQLLSHYLAGLEEWRREKDLEPLRIQAKAKNISLTPEVEKRYLAWLRNIERCQARAAARAGKLATKQAALIKRLEERVKHLPDSWSYYFDR